MKAKPITVLQDIENNEDLVVGRKYNGFSEILVVKDGSVRLFNRSGSEQTDNVPHITGVKVPKTTDLVIPCEGISIRDKVGDAKSIFGSGPTHAIDWQKEHGLAKLVAVNITRVDGEDITHIPFGERINPLSDAVEFLQQLGMSVLGKEELVFKSGSKKRLFDYVTQTIGGEGVVVKSLRGLEKDWFKVKKTKTWDAVVIGFTDGKGKYKDVIGAIRYGFYDYGGNLREVGRCSGMTDPERAMFASAPEAFIGRVVEIKGQELGSKGGIVFPSFVRMRDDKLPVDCLLPC